MAPAPRRSFKLALVQMEAIPGNIDANAKASSRMLEDAASEGAKVAILPELAATSWPSGRDSAEEMAQSLSESSAVAAWAEVAAKARIWIVGGFIERGEDGGIYNSAAVIGPTGPIGRYRKLHLFGPEVRTFDPGNAGLPLFEFGVQCAELRVGVAVCYDLRFPETVKILAAQGAELIAVPTGWVTGFDPASHLEDGMTPQGRSAQIQANLSQVYIAVADRVGSDTLDSGSRETTLNFLGASCLIDPMGEIAAGPASATAEQVIVTEVDMDRLEQSRIRGPGIEPAGQRRTDVYGQLLGYDPSAWTAGHGK